MIRDHVHHPAFGESYSLKSVLPALVPDMSYNYMQVADGQAAGLAWESLRHGELAPEQRERIKRDLLAYCGQDTLGMVSLLEVLGDAINRQNSA